MTEEQKGKFLYATETTLANLYAILKDCYNSSLHALRYTYQSHASEHLHTGDDPLPMAFDIPIQGNDSGDFTDTSYALKYVNLNFNKQYYDGYASIHFFADLFQSGSATAKQVDCKLYDQLHSADIVGSDLQAPGTQYEHRFCFSPDIASAIPSGDVSYGIKVKVASGGTAQVIKPMILVRFGTLPS